MRLLRALVGAGCVLLSASCGSGACAVINPNCLRGSILIFPLDVRFLKGDTVVLSAVGDAGRQSVGWTIEGVGRFVDNGALTDHVAAMSEVRVKLLDAGSMTVRATSLDSDHDARTTYVVDDPSTITALALRKNPSDTVRLPPNIGGIAQCVLLDASGAEHAARPTVWNSTDPSVATISQDTESRGCDGRIHTLSVGMTKVSATFRGLSDTLFVIVEASH